MEVEERVPCEGGWEISLWNSWEKIIHVHVGLLPRDEEFDSTSQRQPLGYESN